VTPTLPRPNHPVRTEEWCLLIAGLAVCLVLGWNPPADRLTWAMENATVWVGVPVLMLTRRRFPLTPLVERLILFHAVLLMVGGHWTYERVPLGNWVRDALDLERNHYDRLGHFVQGFVPVLIAREVFLRTSPLRPGGWLRFHCVCFCLALAAVWEMLEWWTAVLGGESADAFLGSQGDIWDAQWDMFLCGVGAVISLALFSRVHDRQLRRLEDPPPVGR
jgi:putative membrane protein